MPDKVRPWRALDRIATIRLHAKMSSFVHSHQYDIVSHRCRRNQGHGIAVRDGLRLARTAPSHHSRAQENVHAGARSPRGHAEPDTWRATFPYLTSRSRSSFPPLAADRVLLSSVLLFQYRSATVRPMAASEDYRRLYSCSERECVTIAVQLSSLCGTQPNQCVPSSLHRIG